MPDRLRTVVAIVAAAIFLLSGARLCRIFYGYHAGAEEYREIAEKAGEPLPIPMQAPISFGDGENAGGRDTVPQPDHAALKAINPDYIGWITMNGDISYPVVQGKDNSYYLKHTFYGTENKAGAIFMDASIQGTWDGANPIIYGHNLKNDTMFAGLMEYENQEYYEAHPQFTVYTEAGIFIFDIFSVYRTGEYSKAYCAVFADSDSFREYIRLAQSRSEIDTGVEVSRDDKIILLSTCTNVGNGRLVIHGKLAGEIR